MPVSLPLESAVLVAAVVGITALVAVGGSLEVSGDVPGELTMYAVVPIRLDVVVTPATGLDEPAALACEVGLAQLATVETRTAATAKAATNGRSECLGFMNSPFLVCSPNIEGSATTCRYASRCC